MFAQTWPTLPLRRWGIKPTREGSLSAVTRCMAHRLTLTLSGGAERPPTADGATKPRRTAVPPSAAVGVRRDLLAGLATRSRRSSENRPCYEWQGYAQAASAVPITIASSSIISEATVVA
jgi:hypothetical protein